MVNNSEFFFIVLKTINLPSNSEFALSINPLLISLSCTISGKNVLLYGETVIRPDLISFFKKTTNSPFIRRNTLG